MTLPIADLDVPAAVLEQRIRDLIAAPCELCDAPTPQPEPTPEEAS